MAKPAGWDEYKAQGYSAKRRGIPFLFTFEEWWAWWQIDDRWEFRGLKGNGLVMARKGDKGAYEPGNVYCATAGQNQRDIPPEKRREATAKMLQTRQDRGLDYPHLRDRERHPMARKVVAPDGTIYPSTAIASERTDIPAHKIQRMARGQRDGWRYANDKRKPLKPA